MSNDQSRFRWTPPLSIIAAIAFASLLGMQPSACKRELHDFDLGPVQPLDTAPAADQAPDDAPASGGDLWFVNAQVINPRTKTISKSDIQVTKGKITAVVPAGTGKPSGSVVDLKGKWLMPAMADLHVHTGAHSVYNSSSSPGSNEIYGVYATARLTPEKAASLYAMAGVGAILDLFSSKDYVSFRDKSRANPIAAAALYAAGDCITSPKGHCSEYGTPTTTLSGPGEAAAAIAKVAAVKPDVIKIVSDHMYAKMRAGQGADTLERASIKALIDEAKKRGLKTVVHVGSVEDMEIAASSGAAAITHLTEDLIPDDVIDLMATQKILYIPTYVVHQEMLAIVQNNGILSDPLLRKVVPAPVIDTYRAAAAGDDEVSWQKYYVTSAAKNLQNLMAAKVPIGLGTDAGNIGVFHGFSVHRELQHYVKAGLSSWDALRTATTNASDFLGANLGVDVGNDASLIVLGASPIESISNTTKIEAVYINGQLVKGVDLTTNTDAGSTSGSEGACYERSASGQEECYPNSTKATCDQYGGRFVPGQQCTGASQSGATTDQRGACYETYSNGGQQCYPDSTKADCDRYSGRFVAGALCK